MIAEKFAEKWHRSHPNDRKALDIFKKSTRLKERSNLELILHQYNLANEITLSYTQNSIQLVEYLIEEFCFSAESSMKGIVSKFFTATFQEKLSVFDAYVYKIKGQFFKYPIICTVFLFFLNKISL